MKRKTALIATFLITVFAAATILFIIPTAQHPAALTEKSMAYMQHHDISATNVTTPIATPTPTPTPTSEPPYIPPPQPYVLTQ